MYLSSYFKKSGIAFLFICFIGIVPVYSQKIKLNTYLDTTAILIGDQLFYNIELQQPLKVKVIFPKLSDTLASKIEIVGIEPADTIKKEDSWLIRKKYLITSFDSGVHEIPSFKFAFTIGEVKDTISSSILSLKVNTLPVDTAQKIMDIKPIMNAPFSLKEIKWQLIIGFGILMIIGLGIWIYLRFRKNRPLFTPKKIIEPPHIIALRQLDILRSEKLWQNNQVKLYYTRLTDILRQYISGRFGINAMEMTSEEILSALDSELNKDMELKASFSKFFVLADMVKFAKAQTLPDENEISLLGAFTFVNRTKIESVINNKVNIDNINKNIQE
jgi:hypothetical protein